MSIRIICWRRMNCSVTCYSEWGFSVLIYSLRVTSFFPGRDMPRDPRRVGVGEGFIIAPQLTSTEGLLLLWTLLLFIDASFPSAIAFRSFLFSSRDAKSFVQVRSA